MKLWVPLTVLGLLIAGILGTLILKPVAESELKKAEKVRHKPVLARGGGGSDENVALAANSGDSNAKASKLDVSSIANDPDLEETFVVTKPETPETIPDDTLVIGVQSGGKQMAYPVDYFSPTRTSINDTVGPSLISVVWDNTNRSAAAFIRNGGARYAALVDRWKDSIVLLDDRSKSVWSLTCAKGIRGDREGVALYMLPTTLTTWKKWKSLFPQTRLMDKPADLSTLGLRPQLPTIESAKDFVIGSLDRGKPYHMSLATAIEKGFCAGENGFFVYFDAESSWPYVYRSTIENRKVELELRDGKIANKLTKTLWEPISGRTADGSEGRALEVAAAIICKESTWMELNPTSRPF